MKHQLSFLAPNLIDQLNPKYPLLQLAKYIPCSYFDTEFAPLYAHMGRPAEPIRLMLGLCILKHLENLSDECVLQLWVKNPYYQALCGEVEFQWAFPCDHSDLLYFRQPVGTAGIKKVLTASIVIYGDKEKEYEVGIDTTVQEKAIIFPTDAKLYRKIIVHCLKIAKANGIRLRRANPRILMPQSNTNDAHKEIQALLSFNQQITGCATARFAVTDYEQALIKELLASKIEHWKHLPTLEALLIDRNLKSRRFIQQEITECDKKWAQKFMQNNFSYSNELIDQELSAQLREIEKQSQDVLTEIIVTDARGLNIAISDMTSDYWRGDEEKFTAAFSKPANTMHFGEINYDESTKRFQLQISVPLYSAEKLEPLGVMVLGVDVEKVLSQAH